MRSRALLIAGMLLLGIACTPESGAPLAVSEVRLFVPLTDKHAAVGYLTLHNQGSVPLTIERISSTSFANIQMHETLIRDGVASMHSLPPVTIAPDASVVFAAGGKHLMLMQPTSSMAAGTAVELEIHYDSGGLVIVSAAMQDRMPAGQADELH